MIKNFEEYINEDYFSKLASRKDNEKVRGENNLTKELVTSCISKPWINSIKSISLRKENNIMVADIVGNCILSENITIIPFQFGKVTGDFDCSTNLKSLEGCPMEITGNFNCCGCEDLKSLEGCPKQVGGDFECYDCGKQFTKKEVKSLCNVKGNIIV